MAEYTNLTSLKNLKEGDIITYDTTTTIDFDGAIVKVELYGHSQTKNASYTTLKGGYTTFTIDTSQIPNKIFSFNNDVSELNGTQYRTTVTKRNDLIYGDTTDLYYRIAVAGSAGTGSGDENGGSGGGTTGQNGTYENSLSSTYSPTGGSQTSGGISKIETTGLLPGTRYGYIGSDGIFGKGGAGGNKKSGGDYVGGNGGYGWYGGAGGCGGRVYSNAGGAGGSGFVIGYSTTTYPSGYLGDDTRLQSIIAASITDAVLTQGGSIETTPKMVLTIIKVGSSGSSQSVIQYYNGTEFIDINVKYYNGSEFIDCNAYYYDGTEFKKL